METLTCNRCKQQILFLPDVKEMAKAIRNHAQQHHRWNRVNVINELTKQLLVAAGDPDVLQVLDEKEKEWVIKWRNYR